MFWHLLPHFEVRLLKKKLKNMRWRMKGNTFLDKVAPQCLDKTTIRSSTAHGSLGLQSFSSATRELIALQRTPHSCHLSPSALACLSWSRQFFVTVAALLKTCCCVKRQQFFFSPFPLYCVVLELFWIPILRRRANDALALPRQGGSAARSMIRSCATAYKQWHQISNEK